MKTSDLDSHTTNDVKPEILSGVKTRNRVPHDEYNVRGIAHACIQKRRHFHEKATSAKLYIYIVVGARDMYIDEAHMDTELDIYSGLQHFF